MLCDDLLVELTKREDSTVGGHHPDFHTAVKNPLTIAQRFVLSPLTVETCNQLADPEKIESTRDYLVTPAHRTWIEWRGNEVGYTESNRHGLLLMGEGKQTTDTSLVIGQGMYAFDVRDSKIWPVETVLFVPISYDLITGQIITIHKDSLPVEDRLKVLRSKLPPSVPDRMIRDTLTRNENSFETIQKIVDQKALGAFLAASLALINTPRLSQRTLHEAPEKLNKARIAKKKPPLLSWHEVNICVDRGELGHGEEKGETGERAFHHVRTHFRLHKGRVQIVKPHWRGNPEKGVIMHRHVVSRIEDECGEWKGGPLPFPRIIKEFE